MSTVDSDLDKVQEKLWQRIGPRLIKDGDCWIWPGGKVPSGYGRFSYRDSGKQIHTYVHRLAYEIFRGPIADDLEIDHLCRRRNCANPSHLEVVTHRENILRGETFAGRQSRQTHCKRGHKFDFKNTHITPEGERRCRKCNVIKTKRHREKWQRSLQI